MTSFQAYFRHGNLFADPRTPPSGAAPAADPHSWSYETNPASDSPADPHQNTPLIENDRDRSPQLTISSETYHNGLYGILRTLFVFTLRGRARLLFPCWLIVHHVRNTGETIIHERAFLVDESSGLTALAISSF